MPAIRDRGEGNAKRKDRLAKLKKGPGVFVYDGSAVDVEHIPTPLLTGKKVPELDGAGMPLVDGAGRQVFKRAGTPVRNDRGEIIMGGAPKVVRHPINVFEIHGFAFPKGEPIHVDNDQLALKLRGMDCFTEVDAAALGDAAPKKRGRRSKAEAEQVAEG